MVTTYKSSLLRVKVLNVLLFSIGVLFLGLPKIQAALDNLMTFFDKLFKTSKFLLHFFPP